MSKLALAYSLFISAMALAILAMSVPGDNRDLSIISAIINVVGWGVVVAYRREQARG